MGFQKKTNYERIYDWVDSKEGTCYYCYEDKLVAVKLMGNGSGICQECVDSFKIGHFGSDRHAIDHLCDATTHKKTVAWIKKHGGKLEFEYSSEIGDGMCHFYKGINKNGESNPVQIMDDGSIHIVY